MTRTSFLAALVIAALASGTSAIAEDKAGTQSEAPPQAAGRPVEAEAPKGPAPLPRIPGITVPMPPAEQDTPQGGCRYQPRSLELIV